MYHNRISTTAHTWTTPAMKNFATICCADYLDYLAMALRAQKIGEVSVTVIFNDLGALSWHGQIISNQILSVINSLPQHPGIHYK